MLGQGALNEAFYAIANKVAVVVVTVLFKPAFCEHIVAAGGQVAYGVEKGAVEV